MNFSTIRTTLLASLAAISFAAPSFAQTPEAALLLKEADRARGAAEEGISWEIDVDTIEDGSTNKVHYLVKVKGVDALAEATAPARNKGEMMLFNDRNLWIFRPGNKKPMAISPRQKLMGQAANGDIASTNYARDYDGTVIGSDMVDGVDCWKLDLKAKAKNVTYDGIHYWISKAGKVGVKAEFLTVGGKMFKSATFEYKNTMKSGGKEYPFVSKMTIVDALKADNKTTISYGTPKAEKLADSLFNVNNLVR